MTRDSRVRPFNENAEIYDQWFEGHEAAYESELEAVRHLLPAHRRAL